jgi:hypothetical protein
MPFVCVVALVTTTTTTTMMLDVFNIDRTRLGATV